MAALDWLEGAEIEEPSRGVSRDGWEGSAPDGVRRTKMDAGPGKRRGDSVASGYVEPFPFKWTQEELESFDAWYLAHRADRFNFPHPIWGTVEACFEGPARYSPRGGKFLVTVRLEIYR